VSHENVQAVERVLATLRYTSPDELTDALLAELFDPDIEWLPVTSGVLADRYGGYEGLREFFAAFLGTWTEFDAQVRGFREIGDHVVTTLLVTGRRPDLSLSESWSALWTIHNHRVTRMEGFASLAGASEALGMDN
jgi:ketosteroid isomerase-like protein